MASVFVNIPVAATRPSGDELKARYAVIAAIDIADVGTCTGAGGGVGAMDFSYWQMWPPRGPLSSERWRSTCPPRSITCGSQIRGGDHKDTQCKVALDVDR